jgi:hypothetical protein
MKTPFDNKSPQEIALELCSIQRKQEAKNRVGMLQGMLTKRGASMVIEHQQKKATFSPIFNGQE